MQKKAKIKLWKRPKIAMFPMNAKARALQVIQKCATPNGLYASAPPDGYTMVFARDAMITLIGASATPTRLIQNQFKKSLVTLGKYQSSTGQIPNAVDHWDPKRLNDVSYSTIDSTLWWLVGLKVYVTRFKDTYLLRKLKTKIQKSFFWLRAQDTGEDSMPEQHPTSDWQDAFPHKYGHAISTQALYYWALRLHGQDALARQVRAAVNGHRRKDWQLWDKGRGYYLPWSWKMHDAYRETEYWFDALGNLLAVLTGLADKKQSKSILTFIARKKVNSPFPMRTIFPPIRPKTAAWQDYFKASAAGVPYEYLNGGIWPFIGGFYVCALVKTKQFNKAQRELERLAESNVLHATNMFPEWIHPKTREAYGKDQAWSAGIFLLADSCVTQKKALVFE